MIRRLRPCYAVAVVTVLESLRGRLWLPVAGVAVLVAIAAARLSAVDETARHKLAVALVCGGIGFTATLLAVLVGAQQVRRDLDARLSVTLFSKPVGALAYLGGRWAGLLATMAAALLVLAVAGCAAMAWIFRDAGLPGMRTVVRPAGWEVVSSLGELVPAPEGRPRLALSGQQPGNGVRWRVAGLDAEATPEGGWELLLKVRVQGSFENPLDTCRASLTAVPAAGGAAIPLALDARSPYGRGSGEPRPGEVVLADRAEARNDLGQDYLRLRLPRECVAADGSARIQLVRLEAAPVVTVARDDGLLVSAPGGSFLANLLRGGMVVLAASSLLAAFSLLLALGGNLGTALLGGLTLYFAGNALGMVAETLQYERYSTPVRRLLEAAQVLLPDLDRHQVGALLAAGRRIGWDVVADAWLRWGAYAAILLACAWLALRRREV